jgi:hypothetical protein
LKKAGKQVLLFFMNILQVVVCEFVLLTGGLIAFDDMQPNTFKRLFYLFLLF